MLTPRLAVYFGQPVGIGVHGGSIRCGGADVKRRIEDRGSKIELARMFLQALQQRLELGTATLAGGKESS